MKYFHISNGLRRCYMPDNAYNTIAVSTRRELKAAIESEAVSFRDAGYLGSGKSAVASLAADAWRNTSRYASIMPLAAPHDRTSYSYALYVAPATRAEFIAAQEESF